ncbi:hypothetical protein [Thalassobaculum sp.]|uniref:hypothetical protein n=1 Tax=Thalassobaculum sp. TaxID=2022740 RepID=UPI0032ED50D6
MSNPTASNPSTGGRYVVAKDGKPPKREAGTEQHPDGARARGADGVRLNRPAPAAERAVREPIAAQGTQGTQGSQGTPGTKS